MKVHIIGLAGSGKTTLAAWISERFGVAAHDLDWIVYDEAGERPEPEIVARIGEILREPGWVTEGAYHQTWLQPLLQAADRIVWLDPPLPVCVFRMLKRHAVAELRRDNAHPGWLRLVRFLRYTARTSGRQRADARALLAPHASMITRCTSSSEVRLLQRYLIERNPAH